MYRTVKRAKRKVYYFTIYLYSLFIGRIYGKVRFTRVTAVPHGRAVDVECRAQARCSILGRGTTEAFGIRRGRCARGVVTSHAVTVSICWPRARGNPCEARGLAGAALRMRIEVRGFQSVDLLSAVSAEAEPRTPELRIGIKAENARTFRRRIQRQSRERPSSWQERRSITPESSGDGFEGREHSCLLNSERKSREHPCSSRFGKGNHQDSCSREHPCYLAARTDLVLIAFFFGFLVSVNAVPSVCL